MTASDAGWQRLSPRMLFVHPVHEVLRQFPLLIGSVVAGSATDNPMWIWLALGLTVAVGLARWFTTSYRIGPDEVRLRTGVLRRKVLAVPRNRIRSVQTDARLLHRLLGLTVLRVSTGQDSWPARRPEVTNRRRSVASCHWGRRPGRRSRRSCRAR